MSDILLKQLEDRRDMLRTELDKVNNRIADIQGKKTKYTPDFEEFWDLYDKKEDKKRAFREWQRLTKTEQQEALEGVPIFLSHHPNEKYRPHPRTYLHNKRWKDEKYSEFKSTKDQAEDIKRKTRGDRQLEQYF